MTEELTTEMKLLARIREVAESENPLVIEHVGTTLVYAPGARITEDIRKPGSVEIHGELMSGTSESILERKFPCETVFLSHASLLEWDPSS